MGALVGAVLLVSWGSGYLEAADSAEAGTGLRPCVGLCTSEGLGLGISGSARRAYLDGTYPYWIAAGAGLFFAGALVAAAGVGTLFLDGPAEDAPAPSP